MNRESLSRLVFLLLPGLLMAMILAAITYFLPIGSLIGQAPTPTPTARPELPTPTPEPAVPTLDEVFGTIEELTRQTEQAQTETTELMRKHYQTLYEELQVAKEDRDEFRELYELAQGENFELLQQLEERTDQLRRQGTIRFVFSLIFGLGGLIVGIITIEIRAFLQGQFQKVRPLPRTLALRMDLSKEEANRLVMRAYEEDSPLEEITKNVLLSWAGANPPLETPQSDDQQ